MHKEGVDVSITGNSTNPTRFQHPVAGTYKKECIEQGKKYFSVASGGGTGRTLHPDNMAAGPASYGMTDTMAVSYTHLDRGIPYRFHNPSSRRAHWLSGTSIAHISDGRKRPAADLLILRPRACLLYTSRCV